MPGGGRLDKADAQPFGHPRPHRHAVPESLLFFVEYRRQRFAWVLRSRSRTAKITADTCPPILAARAALLLLAIPQASDRNKHRRRGRQVHSEDLGRSRDAAPPLHW